MPVETTSNERQALQVQRHSHENLAPGRTRQQRRFPSGVAARMTVEQHPAVLLVQNRPTVKRIHDEPVIWIVRVEIVQSTDQKWPGKFTPSARKPARRATSI